MSERSFVEERYMQGDINKIKVHGEERRWSETHVTCIDAECMCMNC